MIKQLMLIMLAICCTIAFGMIVLSLMPLAWQPYGAGVLGVIVFVCLPLLCVKFIERG
jgi:hypothetical protein